MTLQKPFRTHQHKRKAKAPLAFRCSPNPFPLTVRTLFHFNIYLLWFLLLCWYTWSVTPHENGMRWRLHLVQMIWLCKRKRNSSTVHFLHSHNDVMHCLITQGNLIIKYASAHLEQQQTKVQDKQKVRRDWKNTWFHIILIAILLWRASYGFNEWRGQPEILCLEKSHWRCSSQQ